MGILYKKQLTMFINIKKSFKFVINILDNVQKIITIHILIYYLDVSKRE